MVFFSLVDFKFCLCWIFEFYECFVDVVIQFGGVDSMLININFFFFIEILNFFFNIN